MITNQIKHLKGVVAIGGGHGLGRLLSSLSFLESRLYGIVATTDNGGSSGRLRNETGCIAWGDLRNCLSQLTPSGDIKKLLFEYRFEDAGSLSGHSLGNLMLLALDGMCVRPLETLNLFRDFLGVKSHILPMTETPAHVYACYNEGHVWGEVGIDAYDQLPESIGLTPKVSAPQEAVDAINNAELILLGPGSFFTSVTTPLLVPEIRDALVRSTAKKIYIANMVVEDGPAGLMSLDSKLQWLHKVTGQDIVDAVIWPSTRDLPTKPNKQIGIVDLTCQEHERLHDQVKLATAIEDVYAQLTL